jgi:hypothetical protein
MHQYSIELAMRASEPKPREWFDFDVRSRSDGHSCELRNRDRRPGPTPLRVDRQAREHDNGSKSGPGATCELAASRISDSVMNLAPPEQLGLQPLARQFDAQ